MGLFFGRKLTIKCNVNPNGLIFIYDWLFYWFRMKMNYLDMINKDKKKQFADEYNKSDGKFTLASSTFNVFTNKNWKDADKELANQNWKAHISIHPDDLAKAWDLIYPLLHESADQFKIIDANRLLEALPLQNKGYQDALKTHNDFTQQYLSNEISLDDLESLAKRFSNEQSEYASILGDEKALFEYIESKFAEKEASALQIVEEGRRMSEGMQITIYMQPGSEKKHQELMEKIEGVLTENNIRPGNIYKTDRPLGSYTSVRHPGKDYHDAVAVESYNPDNVADNFDTLINKKIEQYENILKSAIQTLKSSNVTPGMNETQKHNAEVKQELGKKLDALAQDFDKLPPTEKRNQLEQFKNECTKEVKASDKQLKNDREWKPIIKHIALALTGFGTVLAIASIVNRIKTGRYDLFDNKESLLGEDNAKPSQSKFTEIMSKFKDKLCSLAAKEPDKGPLLQDSEENKQPESPTASTKM